MSSTLSKQRGGDGGQHGYEAKASAPSGNPCLLVGGDGACVGGVRLASRLYEAVSGFAMLLFGFLASLFLAMGVPTGERIKARWIAAAATCLVCAVYFLIAAISAELWVFGL